MDTGKPTPKIAELKVQETLHFRYRTKFLLNCGFKDPGKLWNSKQDRTIGEACAAWI